MIKIIKEEIEIDESLVFRLNAICDFCNTTPIIENGSIRKIEHTNLLILSHIELLLIINLIIQMKSMFIILVKR